MITDKLYSDIQNICESKGLNLYDIEMLKENDSILLRISLYKKSGITLDDCEEISNIISPLLDVELENLENYNLEVSSPGVERVLKKPNHFKYSLGELVEIRMLDKSVLKGVLKDFDNENIMIESRLDSKKKGAIESKKIPLKDCKKIKTIFELEN